MALPHSRTASRWGPGDSDSIACLTGAFLGAAYGMDAWPADWASRIEYADQLRSLSHTLADRSA